MLVLVNVLFVFFGKKDIIFLFGVNKLGLKIFNCVFFLLENIDIIFVFELKLFIVIILFVVLGIVIVSFWVGIRNLVFLFRFLEVGKYIFILLVIIFIGLNIIFYNLGVICVFEFNCRVIFFVREYGVIG